MLYIDEKATPYRPPRGFPYKYEQKGIPLTHGQNGGQPVMSHLKNARVRA